MLTVKKIILSKILDTCTLENKSMYLSLDNINVNCEENYSF